MTRRDKKGLPRDLEARLCSPVFEDLGASKMYRSRDTKLKSLWISQKPTLITSLQGMQIGLECGTNTRD